MEKWLTVKDVKEYLQCSTPTLYRLVKNKKFPPQYKIGGMSRWKKEEIDKFIVAINKK